MSRFPTDDHARLNILTGTWDTRITMLGPDGAPDETSRATDVYTWMPNGHFLVHEVDADMGGHRTQSVEIFGVAEDGDFFSRSYDPDGKVNDFRSQVVGRAYSIVGQVQQFSGTFSADGMVLEGEWKHLVDGKWLPFVRVRLDKRL